MKKEKRIVKKLIDKNKQITSEINTINKTRIPNSVIQNESLSLKAKGLYSIICCYINENRIVNKERLMETCKDGIQSFESAWKELKNKGYLIQHKTRNGSNGFSYEYELFDGPITNNRELLEASTPGYIYVMKCLGYYKIGISIDCKRLGEYTHLPEEPEYPIIELVNDMNKMEMMIHSKYDDLRLRGNKSEWFSLSEKDIDDIKDIIQPFIVKDPIHSTYYYKYVTSSNKKE